MGRDRSLRFRLNAPIYPSTPRMTSTASGMPRGRLATPNTIRTEVLPSPKTSRNSSEAASATPRAPLDRAGPQHHCESLIMPYPVTRRCVRVGGKEFNSHSFAPCCHVADVDEAFPGAAHHHPIGCISAARRCMYLGVKVRFSLRTVQLRNGRDDWI